MVNCIRGNHRLHFSLLHCENGSSFCPLCLKLIKMKRNSSILIYNNGFYNFMNSTGPSELLFFCFIFLLCINVLIKDNTINLTHMTQVVMSVQWNPKSKNMISDKCAKDFHKRISFMITYMSLLPIIAKYGFPIRK